MKDVVIAQTRGAPPRSFVVASGEARTAASTARLVPCALPSAPELLQLDFEAGADRLQAVAKVTAVYELDGDDAFHQVTVHAETSSITRAIRPGGDAE